MLVNPHPKIWIGLVSSTCLGQPYIPLHCFFTLANIRVAAGKYLDGWLICCPGRVDRNIDIGSAFIGRGTDISIIHAAVDVNQKEIMGKFSGVLSFAQNGTGHAIFRDAPEGEKEITIHYAITLSSAPRSFNELSSKWGLTRAFTGSIQLRAIDLVLHLDLEELRSIWRGRASSDDDSLFHGF